MLTILSVLWGGSFFFVGVMVSDLPPLTIVSLRVGLAALALWVIVLVMGLHTPRNLRVWLAFFGMGVLNNVIPFSLIVWGQTHVASGVASILNATTPFFTVIVASLLLPDERATPAKFLGVVVGCSGVVVMFDSSTLGDDKDVLAQVAILSAALSYALAGVFGRRFGRMRINPIVTAAGQVTASTVVLAPVAFYFEGMFEFTGLGLDSYAAIVGLAVLSTAAAYVLYFKILEVVGATNLLLVALLIPVSAILLGSLVLGETLEFAHLIGMALIALGLLAVDGRVFRGYQYLSNTLSSVRLYQPLEIDDANRDSLHWRRDPHR